jgi:AraC family transcriptional regulator
LTSDFHRSTTCAMKIPLDIIQSLVGDIDDEPFRYVDFAVTDNVGLFVPVSGQCDYSTTPEHTHPAYSFVVSFDDFCRVKIDGNIISSKAGTFSAFAPGVPHQELKSETPSRYVAIMIAAMYFEEQALEYHLELPKLQGTMFESTPRLVFALKEFMSEYEEKAPGYLKLLHAAGETICHLIIRQILAPTKRNEKVDYRMAADETVAFMHANLHEKITLTDLAHFSRLSVSQFTRVFKEELETTPIEYLQELRLIRAKRLLKDSDKTITEIALQCGFNSSSYFSRCFANRFNTSASDYRKSFGTTK